MPRKIHLVFASVLSLFILFNMGACTPRNPSGPMPTATLPPTSQPSETPATLASSSTPKKPPAATAPPTSTPYPKTSWPVYTLATELPTSPAEVRLYMQAYPAGLPSETRLAEIMAQLQIIGTVSTTITEGGDQELMITSEAGSFYLLSDDPFLLQIRPPSSSLGNSEVVLPVKTRIQKAEAFLQARGLLDFPYLLEPPLFSRDRNRAVRVIPLLDGYPIYDYDALNGRLLVWFNAEGEISVVFWRPFKFVPGDLVQIVPVETAWAQLVEGKQPKTDVPGQCWLGSIFDPADLNDIAGALGSISCYSPTTRPDFEAATITEVKLVYLAGDLSQGMSPFAFPADSPARLVYPMWQFTGTTSDQRDIVILWPAMAKP